MILLRKFLVSKQESPRVLACRGYCQLMQQDVVLEPQQQEITAQLQAGLNSSANQTRCIYEPLLVLLSAVASNQVRLADSVIEQLRSMLYTRFQGYTSDSGDFQINRLFRLDPSLDANESIQPADSLVHLVSCLVHIVVVSCRQKGAHEKAVEPLQALLFKFFSKLTLIPGYLTMCGIQYNTLPPNTLTLWDLSKFEMDEQIGAMVEQRNQCPIRYPYCEISKLSSSQRIEQIAPVYLLIADCCAFKLELIRERLQCDPKIKTLQALEIYSSLRKSQHTRPSSLGLATCLSVLTDEVNNTHPKLPAHQKYDLDSLQLVNPILL